MATEKIKIFQSNDEHDAHEKLEQEVASWKAINKNADIYNTTVNTTLGHRYTPERASSSREEYVIITIVLFYTE